MTNFQSAKNNRKPPISIWPRLVIYPQLIVPYMLSMFFGTTYFTTKSNILDAGIVNSLSVTVLYSGGDMYSDHIAESDLNEPDDEPDEGGDSDDSDGNYNKIRCFRQTSYICTI